MDPVDFVTMIRLTWLFRVAAVAAVLLTVLFVAALGGWL
jgi:hypothetical protein